MREISERLSAKGHEVLVLTTDPSGRLSTRQVLNGVEVRRLRSIAPSNSYYLPVGLFEAVKRSGAEVIHAHSFHALPSLMAAMAKGNRRFVTSPHYHGHAHSPFRERLFYIYKKTALRAIVEASEKILCVSEYEQTLIEKDFPNSVTKTLVIPNGVNLEELREVRWRPRSEGLKILYVGRIEAYKNLDKLIEAAGVLREQGETVGLTIVGRGPHKPHLKRLSKRLGVAESIYWKEDLTKEELYGEYSSSNVFVLLSTDEAFGIAAAEAMVIGLPTVLANASVLSSYVEKDFALGVDPSFDSTDVADRILEALLEGPPDVERVRRHFLSWEEVVERLEGVYEDLRG